ncbi:MAG TPA: Fic family protein [Verrucomicrobiae bacterium]|jgi:Fic family protein|nr:Fic family protein [Verrucomicrobiae bacterium]
MEMKIPVKPPDEAKLFGSLKLEKLNRIFQTIRERDSESRYLHWDELRFRNPPQGLTPEEWWLTLKLRRKSGYRNISLKDKSGQPFQFCVPDLVVDLLHQIDRGGGTFVQIPEQITNADQRDRYVIRSLMEEAITSSQLEGAATTREVAKKMLAEGRKPRNHSERMIANNFATMQHILELKENPLTPEMVFQIHREISQNALDIPDGAGRFRRLEEAVDVSDIEGNIFHVPPNADELPARLQAMCDFANAKTPDFFVHPVIRGIILHFWLAYDHPFVDGNGRTSRALFYWQMLHSGYWLFEFISISHFLRKAPAQYGMAFLHTETDENDLTYFIVHQAEIVRKALKELHDYVARKSSETRACFEALEKYPELNHRQQALISHAVRHPGFVYNIASHQARQGITYATARSDLLKLAQSNLFEQKKVGRAFIFVAPKDLESRLKSKTG